MPGNSSSFTNMLSKKMAAVRRRKRAVRNVKTRKRNGRKTNTKRSTRREIANKGSLKTSLDRRLRGRRELRHPGQTETVSHSPTAEKEETPLATIEDTRIGTGTTITTAGAEVIQDLTTAREDTEATRTGKREAGEAAVRGTTRGGATVGMGERSTGEREEEDIITMEVRATTDETTQRQKPGQVIIRKIPDPATSRRRTARTVISTTAGRRGKYVQTMLEFVIIELTYNIKPELCSEFVRL